MAHSSHITIEISYRLRGQANWHAMQLTPQQYFWFDPDDPDDVWEVDSVSQHSQSIGFLPAVVREEVEFVRHVARNPITGAWQQRFYHVWSHGRSFSCRLKSHLPGIPNRDELIIANALPFEHECSETLRFDLTSGDAVLMLNWIGYGSGGDEYSVEVFPVRENSDGQ